jgi:hypothetical protein
MAEIGQKKPSLRSPENPVTEEVYVPFPGRERQIQSVLSQARWAVELRRSRIDFYAKR